MMVMWSDNWANFEAVNLGVVIRDIVSVCLLHENQCAGPGQEIKGHVLPSCPDQIVWKINILLGVFSHAIWLSGMIG